MVITTKAARPTAAQPRSRWWPGIVLAIAAIGAVATAGYFVFARRQPMPRAERPGAPLTPPTLSPSLSSVTPHCEVHVHRTPPTARLTLDGISVAGDTLRFDTDRKVHTLRVTAPGFGEQELTLDAHSPGDLSVVLQPLTAAVKKPAHHNAKKPEPPSADFDRLTPAFAKPDDRRK